MSQQIQITRNEALSLINTLLVKHNAIEMSHRTVGLLAPQKELIDFANEILRCIEGCQRFSARRHIEQRAYIEWLGYTKKLRNAEQELLKHINTEKNLNYLLVYSFLYKAVTNILEGIKC